ncbi:MAG: head-tail connector protein [Hyphomicrobiales bacterium]
MPSILTTPPAIEPISLAEAKAHLRVAHADEDVLIGRLIVAARRQAEAQTGLLLISQGWSHFRDDWPEDGSVELPQSPVIALGSIKVYGEDDVATVIDPAHYYIDRHSRPARLLLRGSRVWARPGRIGNGIEIALTAGFGAAATDVPEPLRQAILQLAAHWYEHRGNGEDAAQPLAVAQLFADFRQKRL